MSSLWQWAVNKIDAAEQWLVDDILVGWTPSKIPSLQGKVAVVTGANSGIGYEATRKLAENGAEVYMVVRNMEKGQDALEKITKELGPVKLHLLHTDLESMSQVQALIAKLQGVKIDILINNAGVFFPGPFRLTEDGLEQTMAINHFASALLTLGLLDQMTAKSRIVFMSSEGEWPLAQVEASFKNIKGDTLKESGPVAYGTSKAYEIMFARELAARLRHRDIDVFAVQPGLVNTPGHDKMDRKHYLSAWQVSAMGKLLGQNQYHGAWSTLFTATDPSLTGKGFGYYGPNWAGAWHATERQPGTKAARNPVSCWRLFEETVKVLENTVGSKAMPPVPRHPDESRGAASLKGNIRSITDKSNVQRPMAVAA